MRIMGLDYGGKRIGVAVSDELQITAQGLLSLEREHLSSDIYKIKNICHKYQVQEVVVGYPLHLSGKAGETAKEAEAFKEELQKVTGIPVFLWDERFTTRMAENTLLQADVSRSKRKIVKDKLAAVLILESYLESKQPQG